MTVTKVKEHTRGKPDPFAPVMEAKRKDYARKWGVELVGSNDDRLSVPVADPVPGPGNMPIEHHRSLLKTLATMLGVK